MIYLSFYLFGLKTIITHILAKENKIRRILSQHGALRICGSRIFTLTKKIYGFLARLTRSVIPVSFIGNCVLLGFYVQQDEIYLNRPPH